MKLRSVLVLLAAFACGGVIAAPAAADKVHLRGGRIVEGQVVKETADQVTVKVRLGEVTFPRDEVIKIEKELTAEQQLEQDLASAKSADDCVAAARAAKEAGLKKDKVAEAWERALRFDPDLREAHEALGHVEVDGKWLADDDAKLDAGWEWYRGELMPPDKVAGLRKAERDKVRGDAAKNREAYLKELKGVSWGAAHIIETDHYIVKCNSSRAVAERYADFLEKIYKSFDAVFAGKKRFFQGKSTIYIFRSIQDFQEYGGGRPGTGGFYRAQSPNENLYPNRIISCFHGTFGTTGDTRLVLAHEGAHQFQHIMCDGDAMMWNVRPAWWIEGVAVYMGDSYKLDSKGNLTIGIPRDRLMYLQQYIRNGSLVPISKFTRFPYRSLSMYGPSYPYAWGLVHYFYHRGEEVTGRGRRQRVKHKKVKIGSHEVDLREAFTKFFDYVLTHPPQNFPHPGAYAEHYGDKLDEFLGFPADELTEDWNKYILGLELEKLGDVSKDGTTFTSDELAFQIQKPGDWEWRQEETQGREAIRLENPKTGAQCVVTAQGNMDNSPLEELKYNAERGAEMKFESLYTYGAKEIEVAGYPALEFFYEGKEVAPLNPTGEVKVRENEQRYRHIVISSVKRSYEIVMQADLETFDDNLKAFKAIVDSFRIRD